jgi:transposase
MAAWTDRGKPAVIPITGSRSKRILFGTISLNGGLILHDAEQGTQEEFQSHLHMIRAHWRGWNLILFLDRGSIHTAEDSELLAQELGIEVRWLPIACPKMNPMDHLWRHVKGDVLSNFADQPLSQRIEYVYQYLQDLGPLGWSRKAGLFSEKFWLKEYVTI